MSLLVAAHKILGQLADLVNQISYEDFYRPSETLGGSTIGQHVRHTVEFFSCFKAGYSGGVVNYDKRAHDIYIECDKAFARECIDNIITFVSDCRGNHSLQLELAYNSEPDICEKVETSVRRELVYNIEHAVHHMAMIRIALREVAPYIRVADDFGIAASTARHRLDNTAHSR